MKVVFQAGPRNAFWFGSDSAYVSNRNLRTMKTNMWSFESLSLLAGEGSIFIPEDFTCHSYCLFWVKKKKNLKRNQISNMEHKLLKKHQGAGAGRKRWK